MRPRVIYRLAADWLLHAIVNGACKVMCVCFSGMHAGIHFLKGLWDHHLNPLIHTCWFPAKYNDKIRSQIHTCHDSSAIVIWATLWLESIIRIKIRKKMFTRFSEKICVMGAWYVNKILRLAGWSAAIISRLTDCHTEGAVGLRGTHINAPFMLQTSLVCVGANVAFET